MWHLEYLALYRGLATCPTFLLGRASLDLLILYRPPFYSGDLMMGLPSGGITFRAHFGHLRLKRQHWAARLMYFIYWSESCPYSWKQVVRKTLSFVCLAPDSPGIKSLWQEHGSDSALWPHGWSFLLNWAVCGQSWGEEPLAFPPTGQLWNSKGLWNVLGNSAVCSLTLSSAREPEASVTVPCNCCWLISSLSQT